MNVKFLSIATIMILTIAISGCTQSSQTGGTSNGGSQSGTYNVEIQNFAFNPSQITIKKGETVIWTNKDSTPHTVLSDSGNEINSGSLSNGQTYSHTFNQAGTFEYYCSIHPYMKAKIIVE